MRWFTIGTVVVVLASARVGVADTAATCERLDAEARATELVLAAPRIRVLGARTPSVADAVDPSVSTSAWQARVALEISPIRIFEARAVGRIADAECSRARAAARIDRTIAIGERLGQREAAEAELVYLRAHIGDVDAIVNAAFARVESQRATIESLLDLRERRTRIQARIAELEHTLALLAEVSQGVISRAELEHAARAYREASLEVAHEEADLRSLRAWDVDVQAGVVGGERADWFAVVQLSYSLGQPWQPAANRRAVAARGAELSSSDREIEARVATMGRVLGGSLAPLEREIDVIVDEIELLTTERDRTAKLDSDAARSLHDRITIELVNVGGRHAYAAALAAARRAFQKATP